ncbi:MAG: putative inorganic carbon transporter subunit DabA, partial [Pseudomonadota bacterium]
MPHFRTVYSGEMLELMAAAEASIHQVPPAFPLTATVAVNPFLGQAGEDRATAAARLARVAGIRATRPRAQIAAEIAAGRIEDAELEAAAAAAGLAVGQLFAAAGQPAALAEAHPTVADLAARATGVDWPELIAERVGLWAAAHFDDGQALWPNPTDDPFASWRAFATHDLTPQIAGLPGFCARVAALPAAPRAAFAASCAALGLGAEEAPLYFHRLLMTLGGWAQLARTPGWIAERDDTREDTALALLTIRLVWEAALLDAHGQRLALRWETVRDDYAAPVEPDTEQRVDAALQDAADRAAERRLAALLEAEAPAPAGQARPAVQAIFCIDVRSEVFRRALETSDQGIETIGFAGFFGIATAHCGDASDVRELRGPVLIPAGQQSGGGATAERDLADRLSSRAVRAWGRFRQAA